MEGGGWRKKVKDDSRRYTWKQNHKVGENSSVCKWKDNFFLCFTLAILALRQSLVDVASLKSENPPIRKLPKMQQLTRLKILFRSNTTIQIMFPSTGQGYIGIIGFILEDATMACNEQLAQHFGQSNATFTSTQIDCNFVLFSRIYPLNFIHLDRQTNYPTCRSSLTWPVDTHHHEQLVKVDIVITDTMAKLHPRS